MEKPDILIVRAPIGVDELDILAKAWHRTLVKGVADIERRVIALGGDWHMDANTVLIADGSEQKNVWGFNVYPKKRGDEAIEYESLINIRPKQGNTSMELKDEKIRTKVRVLVGKLIPALDL